MENDRFWCDFEWGNRKRASPGGSQFALNVQDQGVWDASALQWAWLQLPRCTAAQAARSSTAGAQPTGNQKAAPRAPRVSSRPREALGRPGAFESATGLGCSCTH